MTRPVNVSMLLAARASSLLSNKSTPIIINRWRKSRPQSEHARACGMRNETGSIWLCPQAPSRVLHCGCTLPKIEKNVEQAFSHLVDRCHLPYWIHRDYRFARGWKADRDRKSTRLNSSH